MINPKNAKQLKKEAEKQKISDIGMDAYLALKYKAKYIKKRALIDQNNMSNKVENFSYAERKHLWFGEEDEGGIFDEPELNDWYNVWN